MENTPLSYWVKYRQHEDIPQCLMYKGWSKTYDFNNEPLLANWIRYGPDEPIPAFFTKDKNWA